MQTLLILAGIAAAGYLISRKFEAQAPSATPTGRGSAPTVTGTGQTVSNYGSAPIVDSSTDALQHELAVDPFLPITVPDNIASPALTEAARNMQQSTLPRTASELGATYTVPPVSQIENIDMLQDHAVRLAYQNDPAAALALITKFFDPNVVVAEYNTYVERYNKANAAVFAVKGGWPPTPAPRIISVTIQETGNIDTWGTWHFALSDGKYFNTDGKTFVIGRLANRKSKMLDAESLALSLGINL